MVEEQPLKITDQAVLAKGPHNTVMVVFFSGRSIESEVDACSAMAQDLGLDDCPGEPGIYIWEGHYTQGGTSEEPEFHPHGRFREPTGMEWACLVVGENPLDPIGLNKLRLRPGNEVPTLPADPSDS